MRNPALTEAPRNLPSPSKRGGFSPRDTKQQESYMKQTRPEAGIFKGDLRTQTFNPHENKWESVGRKGLSYIHANQTVKISYNWWSILKKMWNTYIKAECYSETKISFPVIVFNDLWRTSRQSTRMTTTITYVPVTMRGISLKQRLICYPYKAVFTSSLAPCLLKYLFTKAGKHCASMMKYFTSRKENVLWLVSVRFALKISKHSPTTQKDFSLLSDSQLGCVWSTLSTTVLWGEEGQSKTELQQHCEGRSWIIYLTFMHWKLSFELFFDLFQFRGRTVCPLWDKLSEAGWFLKQFRAPCTAKWRAHSQILIHLSQCR